MEHRVPTLIACFLGIILWSVVARWVDVVRGIPIVLAVYGLFLLSPLADYFERKER